MRRVFWLKDLGSQYIVENAEDWKDCTRTAKSYAEMIRVKGSRDCYRVGKDPITGMPHRVRYMASHISKHSENTLALYMKDHKKLWRILAEIEGRESMDFYRNEEEFIIPVERFSEVPQIIKFREKWKFTPERREELMLQMMGINGVREITRDEKITIKRRGL